MVSSWKWNSITEVDFLLILFKGGLPKSRKSMQASWRCILSLTSELNGSIVAQLVLNLSTRNWWVCCVVEWASMYVCMYVCMYLRLMKSWWQAATWYNLMRKDKLYDCLIVQLNLCETLGIKWQASFSGRQKLWVLGRRLQHLKITRWKWGRRTSTLESP